MKKLQMATKPPEANGPFRERNLHQGNQGKRARNWGKIGDRIKKRSPIGPGKTKRNGRSETKTLRPKGRCTPSKEGALQGQEEER